MNKNTKTILLVILLLGIWGVIGFRIYEHTNGNANLECRELTYKYQAPIVPEDKEYKLQLNYKDPFLGAIKRVKTVKKSEPKKKSLYNRRMRWPKVEYKGCIYRKKRQLGMIEYKGKLEFIRNGAVLGDLRVIHVYKDSVCLVYKKEKRVFKINKI